MDFINEKFTETFSKNSKKKPLTSSACKFY